MLTTVNEHTFDYRDHLDERRCRPVEWLRARRVELVREERRLRVERLAVTWVLEERGALGPSDNCHRGARC
jgi:hypothetical protein